VVLFLEGFKPSLLFVFFIAPAVGSWRLQLLRENAIRRLEERRGSRVIVLIHHQESINVLGIPLVRYIDVEDSEEILKAIRFTDNNAPIDFVLHTPGALVLAASQIAQQAFSQAPSVRRGGRKVPELEINRPEDRVRVHNDLICRQCDECSSRHRVMRDENGSLARMPFDRLDTRVPFAVLTASPILDRRWQR
jgi:hypothetical protein